MVGYVRAVARAVVLAALVQLMCPLSSALMPLELRKGKTVYGLRLRLKGGSGLPAASELEEAQETMGNMLQEDLDKLENRTAAERIMALQKKWEERAEYQSIHGFLDDGNDDPDFDPDWTKELQDLYLQDEAYMLARRNYTDEHPFRNPNRRVREYCDELRNRNSSFRWEFDSDQDAEDPPIAFLPIPSALHSWAPKYSMSSSSCPSRLPAAAALGSSLLTRCSSKRRGTPVNVIKMMVVTPLHQRNMNMMMMTTTTTTTTKLMYKPRNCLSGERFRGRKSVMRSGRGDGAGGGLDSLIEAAMNVTAEADAGILTLDAAVIASYFFGRQAVYSAMAEGPKTLWGLSKPMTADASRLSHCLNLMSCAILAWTISAVLNRVARSDEGDNDPADAALRALHASAIAAPIAVIATLAIEGVAMSNAELTEVIAGPIACISAWRAWNAFSQTPRWW